MWLYASICIHLRPYANIDGRMPPNAAICDHMRPHASICSHMRENVGPAASTVSWGDFRTCGNICGLCSYRRPYAPICVHRRLYTAICRPCCGHSIHTLSHLVPGANISTNFTLRFFLGSTSRWQSALQSTPCGPSSENMFFITARERKTVHSKCDSDRPDRTHPHPYAQILV